MPDRVAVVWRVATVTEELERRDGVDGLRVAQTLTRVRPPGWQGGTRRIDAAMLAAVGPVPAAQPKVYVCGPTAFVETVADALVALGHDPAEIRTERFGPTGP